MNTSDEIWCSESLLETLSEVNINHIKTLPHRVSQNINLVQFYIF